MKTIGQALLWLAHQAARGASWCLDHPEKIAAAVSVLRKAAGK
jgi:hypothetical protein